MESAWAAGTNGRLEAEVVLKCVRAGVMSHDHRRAGEVIEFPLNWPLALAFVRRNGVLPLVHDALSDRGWSVVPPEVQSQLQTQFRANVARNLAMVAELVDIVRICKQSSIPVIPFKGVILGQQLYGNVANRVSNDLDLLVRDQDAMTVRERLVERGYRPRYELRPGYEEKLLRADRQITMLHRRLPLSVELHTALFIGSPAHATTLDALEKECEAMEINAAAIRVLPRDVLFLYLCAHGTKHGWERLSWIADVAKLLTRHPDLDWARIHARAREFHWERALLLGLTLARNLFGVEVPHIVSPWQPVADAMAEQVKSRLFRDPERGKEGGELAGLRFQLACTDLLRDRIRLSGRILLRPAVADWLAVPLPASMSWMYYAIRPLRLVGKYLRRWVG